MKAYCERFWHFFENLIDRISNGAGYFSAVLNIGLLVLVFTGVIFRYFLKSPINWRDEVSAYIFIVANISALCYATYAESHVSAEMFYNRFPPKVQHAIKFFGYFAVLVFICFIVYFGIQTVHSFYIRGWRSETEYEFVLWPIYSVIPIGFFLFCLQCLSKMRKMFALMRRESSKS